MIYRCGQCGASGSLETLAKNALRRAARHSNDPDAEPTAKRETPTECEICERRPPTNTGLCLSCMAKIRNARRAAHNLTDAEKRARVRAAAEMLFKYGYVAVRLCAG